MHTTQRRVAWLLIAPALIFVIVWRVVPVVFVVAVSFFESDFLAYRFAGFRNYGSTPVRLIARSFAYALSVPVEVAMGTWIAMSRRPKQAIFLYYVPGLAAGVVMMTVWKWIFHWEGPLKAFPWFTDLWWTVLPVGLTQIIGGVGFSALMMSAAVGGVLDVQRETAVVDGATRRQVNLRIVLPQLVPVALILMMLKTLLALQLWAPIYMMAPYEYNETMMYAIFREGFLYGRFGTASAYSVFLLAACSVVILAQRRFAWRFL
jgi:multiple sugar transport system permease protein